MLTGAYQSILLLAIFATFYVMDFWLIHRYDPLRAQGSSRAWDYTIIITLVVAFIIAQPLVLPGLGIRTNAWWGLLAQGIGVLLLIGALVVHGWARLHLRQFFGEREEYQPGQYLITSGPYAYVRHPIYTSFFMFAVGLVLVNPALPTLLTAIYGFIDFSQAARREEKLLSEKLPGYADYMTRTPPFLPHLLKRQGGR